MRNCLRVLATVGLGMVGRAGFCAGVPVGIHVAGDGHSFVTVEGKPWFWLGDTAWCIFNHPREGDLEAYLDDRAGKGFTVIQGCVAVWDYRTQKNVDGELPFVEGDPGRVNEAYFRNVDRVIEAVEARGMYMAVLPFWTKNVRTGMAADPEKMKGYCHFLAKRYAGKNVFWVLGGDTSGRDIQAVIDAEAAGLKEGAAEAGGKPMLITYHPTGKQSSSFWFQERAWLDFDSIQSGHFIDTTNFKLVGDDFLKKPVKPTLDMEPGYENITDGLVRGNPEAKRIGAVDVRRAAYLAVFAGAAGHTYGNGEVYEFYHPEPAAGKAAWHAAMEWKEALKLPAAGQVQYLRYLMESRPMEGRVPDQSLIVGKVSDRAAERVEAIRGGDSSWAFVYFPAGYRHIQFDVPIATGKLSGEKYKVWWYDPRTGKALEGETFAKKDQAAFGIPMQSPQTEEDDWLLVIDDARKGYGAPGGRGK